MKTVVFILPSINGGGAERVMTTIANKFSDKGYNVIFALTIDNTIEYFLHSHILVKYNNNKTSPIGQVKYIREIIKEYNPAIVISFLTYQNLYTLLASIGINTKIIVSERNDPSKSLESRRILEPVRNYLYRYATKIVFQTNGAKDYFSKKIKDKGVVIPNPLKEGLPSRFEGNREKRIVTFARLEPQKNHTLLINAFEKFSKIYDEYILEIYGKGILECDLKNMVKEKCLEDKIKFCGFSSNIHQDILSAKMFVLSSDYEGVSNSMLEALAIGLPCICTDCPPGGARMFIEDGVNGLLVPVGDIDAMAEAMNKIAEDVILAEQLSKNATLICKELTADVICKKWEDIINS